VYPDCRVPTFAGAGFLDWIQVETVLAAHGVAFTSEIHRKLRLCLFEALAIEQAERRKG
jgi:hypothetical protein